MTPDDFLKDVLKLSPKAGDFCIVRIADEAIASSDVDFNSLGQMFKAIPELKDVPIIILGHSTTVELDQPRALKLISEFRKAARVAEGQNGHSTANAWNAAANRILEIVQQPADDSEGPRDTAEASRIITA